LREVERERELEEEKKGFRREKLGEKEGGRYSRS